MYQLRLMLSWHLCNLLSNFRTILSRFAEYPAVRGQRPQKACLACLWVKTGLGMIRDFTAEREPLDFRRWYNTRKLLQDRRYRIERDHFYLSNWSRQNEKRVLVALPSLGSFKIIAWQLFIWSLKSKTGSWEGINKMMLSQCKNFADSNLSSTARFLSRKELKQLALCCRAVVVPNWTVMHGWYL